MPQIDANIPTNRVYKDISLTFTLNPVTSDIVTLSGTDAVKRAIKNILMTQTGEIPFFPDYGSRIRNLLFEPIDPITTALLQSEIFNSISAFEPRVKITSLVLDPDPDNNRYQVNMTFQMLNQASPVTLTLFLTRLR